MKKHLHQQIGDAIYAAKKRLYRSLKLGADLDLAFKCFVDDLTRELAEIVNGESKHP